VIPAPDNVARVKAVLDAGADPNTRYRGAVPLMLAMAMAVPRPEMADSLVAAGGRIEYEATLVRADPVPRLAGSISPAELSAHAIPTRDLAIIGMSVGPLTWALQHGRPDIALRLLERDKRVTPADRHLLFFAAAAGQWDLVLGALPYTREVDAANRADVTPLMMAADDGRADAVRALLAAGARVNARSVRNWPPLSEFSLGSAIAGHSPAPPRLAGGYTALRAAKEKGHPDVVKILAEAGGRE
jgi:ankyrin repeat protein